MDRKFVTGNGMDFTVLLSTLTGNCTIDSHRQRGQNSKISRRNSRAQYNIKNWINRPAIDLRNILPEFHRYSSAELPYLSRIEQIIIVQITYIRILRSTMRCIHEIVSRIIRCLVITKYRWMTEHHILCIGDVYYVCCGCARKKITRGRFHSAEIVQDSVNAHVEQRQVIVDQVKG